MTSAVIVIGVLTIVNSVLLVALAREVGLLHLRLGPIGGLALEDAAPIGSPLEVGGSYHEFLDELGERDRLGVVAFVSSSCSLCKRVPDMLRALHSQRRDVGAVVLVSEDDARAVREALDVGTLGVITDQDSLGRNGITGTPFIAVVDHTSLVVASGVVNDLEQLESVFEDGLTQAEQLLGDQERSTDVGVLGDSTAKQRS